MEEAPRHWLVTKCCCTQTEDAANILIEAPEPPLTWQENVSGLAISHITDKNSFYSMDHERDESYWSRNRFRHAIPSSSDVFFPRLAEWAKNAAMDERSGRNPFEEGAVGRATTFGETTFGLLSDGEYPVVSVDRRETFLGLPDVSIPSFRQDHGSNEVIQQIAHYTGRVRPSHPLAVNDTTPSTVASSLMKNTSNSHQIYDSTNVFGPTGLEKRHEEGGVDLTPTNSPIFGNPTKKKKGPYMPQRESAIDFMKTIASESSSPDFVMSSSGSSGRNLAITAADLIEPSAGERESARFGFGSADGVLTAGLMKSVQASSIATLSSTRNEQAGASSDRNASDVIGKQWSSSSTASMDSGSDSGSDSIGLIPDEGSIGERVSVQVRTSVTGGVNAQGGDESEEWEGSVGEEGIARSGEVEMLIAQKRKFHVVKGFTVMINGHQLELERKGVSRVFGRYDVSSHFAGEYSITRHVLERPPFSSAQFSLIPDLAQVESRTCVLFVFGRQVPYLIVFPTKQALMDFNQQLQLFLG